MSPARRRRRDLFRVVVLLVLASSLSVFAGSLIAPVEARFVNSLVGDTRVVGSIFAAGTLLSFLFSVLVGRKSLSWGRKRTVFFGIVASVVFPVVYATSYNALQYLGGKGVWAFASAATGLMITTLFQDAVKKTGRIGEFSGYRFSAQSIAGSMGALFGGYLGEVYGLRAPYFFLVVVNIVLALVLVLVLRRAPEPSGESPPGRGVGSSLRDILGNPYLFFRFFTEGITQSHWAMEPIVFPFAIYSLTSSDFYTGLVFASMGVIAMFSLPLTGRFVDRHSGVTGLKLAFVLYTVSFFVLAYARSVWVFLAGALLLSLGKTFNGPSMARIETLHIPDGRRPEYLGYFQAYDTITGALAALVTGLLLHYFSPREVLLAYGVFTLAGFLTGYLLFVRKLANWKGERRS